MPYKNKEERLEYARQYSRQYRLNNKEKIKKYQQSPQGKKIRRISVWKQMGLLWETKEEIDEIYNRWLISERCEKCDIEYTETNVKHMDHEHKDGIYGKFRNILCHSCNSKTDLQTNIKNTSGVPNVFWYNIKKRWIYSKTINKKRHEKRFPYFIQAVIYKREYEEKHL